MRILLKILGVVVILAVAAIIALLFIDFDSPRLTEAVVRLASERGGIELEIDRLAFNVRKGVLIEGVSVRTEAEGETVEATLDRLILEHRLWPLLKGQIVVDRLLIERPIVEMVSFEPGTARPAPDLEEAPGADEAPAGTAVEGPEGASAEDGKEDKEVLLLQVGEVVIEGGRFTSRSEGPGKETVLEGFDLQLRDISTAPEASSLLLGLSAEGWIEVSRLGLDDLELSNFETTLEIETGRYRLAAFETESAVGRLRIEEIEVDLSQDPYRYRVDLQADAVDLDRLLGSPGGLGVAAVELRGNGEGPGLAGAVAELSVRAEAGTLPSVTILRRIDQIVGTDLDGAAYQPLDLSASLAGGAIEIDPFEIVTEIVRLDCYGTVVLEQEIDVKVAVGIPRDLFTREGISDEVLDVLTDREQWLTIPLAITGTPQNPRFGPDMDVIAEATRYVAEQAKESLTRRAREELTGFVGGFLGGRE